MNNRTILTLVTFVVAAIAFVYFSTLPHTLILIVLAAALFLHLLIPAKYNRHFATFEIMFFAGYLLGLVADGLLDDIPAWTVWTWLALSLAMSTFFPMPKLRPKAN